MDITLIDTLDYERVVRDRPYKFPNEKECIAKTDELIKKYQQMGKKIKCYSPTHGLLIIEEIE